MKDISHVIIRLLLLLILSQPVFFKLCVSQTLDDNQIDATYRNETIQYIIDSWQGTNEITSSARWESGIRIWLQKLTNEQLQTAMNAGSYVELTTILQQGLSTSTTLTGLDTPLAVATTGQFYYPLTPCRILDTRIATGIYAGPIVGRTEKTFHAKSVTEIENQGGKPGGCGVPTAATALVLNITSTQQAGKGYLTAYPSGEIRPNASIINFSENTVANSTIMPICTPICQSDFTIYAYTTTHVVIDVMGYFSD